MPDPASHPKRSRRLRGVVLVALQALVVVAGVEIGLRLIGPGHAGLRGLLYQAGVATDFAGVDSLPQLMERSVLGYRPLEVHRGYVLNSRSFRSAEYAARKDPGSLRVVALGDSFTYGAVPHAGSWPSLLAETLANAAPERPVELLNLGVPGTGLPFHLRLWELEGSRLGADQVVLMFFVGNDLVEELGGGPGVSGVVDKLATVSHTVRVVRNLWRARVGREGAAELPESSGSGGERDSGGFELPGYAEAFEESRPTFSEEAYLELEADRMDVCLVDQGIELAFRAERVADLLEALDAGVQAAGGKLLVALAPDEYQVSPDLAAAVARSVGRNLAEYDLEAPQRELGERLTARRVEYLDLLPALRRAAATGEVYLPRDTHWNRAGNRVAAEAIQAALNGRAD